MMRKMKNLWLMAALVLGLGTTVTACSDDDGDNNGGSNNTEVGGETVNELGLSDDERVLAALVRQWCDVEPENIKPGIISQTFEPTVGYTSASNPGVRSMVVGTQEAADAYAVSALSALNIDPEQPAGFSWSGSLGTVSYGRGTGNELGVISVNIRQLPHLQKIRLVKDAEENAPNGNVPYYRKGDIVKYTKNGRYYICLNDHASGQPSTWISIDTRRDNRSTGTCGWGLTGKDSVYNGDLATANTVAMWLQSFVLDDAGYSDAKTHMKLFGNSDYIDQLVPDNDVKRKDFIKSLIRKADDVVTDAWQPLTEGGTDIQAVKAGWKAETTKEKSSYVVERYAPTGLLLAGDMRWSMGTTYHYWVPNLSLLKRHKEADALSTRLNKTPSQTTLSKSHFSWIALCDVKVNSSVLDAVDRGDYDLYLTAVHWTHDVFKTPADNKEHYGLLSFTRYKNDALWSGRNTSALELTVTDKGEAYKYFEEVYRRQSNAAKESDVIEEDYTIGDVVIDQTDNSRWFCIRPSGKPLIDQDSVLFVSFDNITTYDNANRSANNIVNQDEAYRLCEALNSFWQVFLYSGASATRDNLINNTKAHAAIDLEKLYMVCDSNRVVKDKNNPTSSVTYGIAFNDGTTNRQPVMRVVFDGTHSLSDGRSEYAKDAYHLTRYYNHYTVWDNTKQWEANWTVTNEKIYLDDVADQQKVDRYGTDKWVVLPHTSGGPRGTKRTVADLNGGQVSRYLWKNGGFVDETARNIYNEPVLFVRVMWVKDKNLVAENGHRLKLVHHKTVDFEMDPGFATGQLSWYQYYDTVAPEYMYVDDVLNIPFRLF